MVTCRECNEKFKIKLKRYKAKCPYCNDIVDFSDMENICLFVDMVFIVSFVACVFIGRIFFYGLHRLWAIGAYLAVLIIVGGIAQTTNKWIVCKMYNKLGVSRGQRD